LRLQIIDIQLGTVSPTTAQNGLPGERALARFDEFSVPEKPTRSLMV
jgi:hypothetical protein